MRHSQVDKRATRTVPRQCVSDYGYNVYKDAPVKIPLGLPFGNLAFVPLSDWLVQVLRERQTKLTPEY